MPNKLLVSAFVALLAFGSCAHTTPAVQVVGHVVDCSAKAVVDQLPTIVAEVATDLLSKDYVALLENVGRRVGTDVLVCAVKDSADGAAARMAATEGEQPNASAIKTHAADYLRLRDVKFAPSPAAPSLASAPICHPACDACHVCFQIISPPGVLIPPTCAPKSPKPAGCP